MDAIASEVSTAGAQQDLHRRVAELERELGEAHHREAATAELLQVINRPQFALQSVFEGIAQSAVRLCEAEFAFVFRFDGKVISPAAAHGLTPGGVTAWRKELPRPAGDDTAIGRANLQRTVVHIPDVQVDPTYRALAHVVTYRSLVAVPLLRDGHPIGGITVGRARAGPFPDGQITLLRSFADQAVIAIENTRLFEAEQASKRELQEALDYRTASSDVLNVISRSPSQLQPVFDKFVESVARLCQAEKAQIFRRERTIFNQCASYGLDPRFNEYVKTLEITPGRGSVTGRVLLERKTVQITDVLADADYSMDEVQRLGGFRTHMGVPLLRQGVPIGVILLSRTIVRPFTEKQIELAETFADQAVIAIENTRLFEAEQASKRELQDSLEYQTATSDVLSVISRSKFDLQPVLDTIARTASGLCGLADTTILLREGEGLRSVAHHGSLPIGGLRSIDRTWVPGRAVVDSAPVHVHDLATAREEFPLGHEIA